MQRQVDVVREKTGSSGKDPFLLCLPNTLEESEVNFFVEMVIMCANQNGNIGVQRSSRNFRPPQQLVSIN